MSVIYRAGLMAERAVVFVPFIGSCPDADMLHSISIREKVAVFDNSGLEAIETVYTYDEWLKEYNRQETKRRIKQRTERLYYIKQRLSGAIMAAIGVIMPFVLDGDVTVSLVALPLGIFLLLTKEKVMTF